MVTMAKRPLKLHVRIASYLPPRNAWRRLLHAAVTGAQARTPVRYDATDKLQIAVRLYLNHPAVLIHDVDNRLKDILDALQGRLGGPKRIREFDSIIPNDNQIYRVVIEKALPPKQSRGFGHVTVSRFRSGGRQTSA
jgi:Endodeoxyribonuclease RusA